MALFNFDYKERPLASPMQFVGRLLGNLIFALVIIAIALAILTSLRANSAVRGMDSEV